MRKMELLARRRVVAEFIKADPVVVQFHRKSGTTKTAAGGYVKNPDIVLPPQQARIVQNRRRYTAGLVNSEAGEIPNTDYLLIAKHNVNVQEEDTFQWLGEHYKIDGIFELRQESILAGITFFGEANRG